MIIDGPGEIRRFAAKRGHRALALLALPLAACSPGCGSSPGAPAGPGEGETSAQARGGEEGAAPTQEHDCADPFEGDEPIAFDPSGWETDFCRRSVELSSIRSGGPPRDGIPPIDDPSFVAMEEADAWLSDVEPVIAIEVGGAARAYPLQVLTWHEIVNDTLAGVPIGVTFCPLCYAAVAFERPEVGGERLTFGTTGNLRKSDLVMWDRQTESWWQQFDGEAIVGELTGAELDKLPAPMMSWADFKNTWPGAEVLSRETGHDRPYGKNPYVGYDDVENTPFLYDGEVGDELPPMERVIGVERGGAARAWAFSDLREERAINDEVGGAPVVVFWRAGTASAMDAELIAASADRGAANVLSRAIDGEVLTFRATDEGFRDRETGSTWTLAGKAIDGPLAGSALEPMVSHDVFWFVWSAFQPDVELHRP